MTEFQLKTYRCVWATECYETDDHGRRYGRTLYTKDWPTRDEALTDLRRVAHPHEHVRGRWVPNEAPHTYVDAGVSYYERLME